MLYFARILLLFIRLSSPILFQSSLTSSPSLLFASWCFSLSGSFDFFVHLYSRTFFSLFFRPWFLIFSYFPAPFLFIFGECILLAALIKHAIRIVNTVRISNKVIHEMRLHCSTTYSRGLLWLERSFCHYIQTVVNVSKCHSAWTSIYIIQIYKVSKCLCVVAFRVKADLSPKNNQF